MSNTQTDMHLASDYKHLNSFADWVETKPVQGKSFAEWNDTFWPSYQDRCYDICRNVYIMNASVDAFEQHLQLGMTWNDAISHPPLKATIREICESTQVQYDEYFSLARPFFEARCKDIFKTRTKD
ncbi:hypothetical protein N9A45_00160 [bacterium]|nr:hypothetical protein [bacterium]